MKRAVIFDLDGTLSDSIASLKYCGDRALAPFGYGPYPESDYKYFVGDGAANLIRRALLKSGDHELVHFEEAFALYQEYFAADCMYQVKPYDGIPELLTALKERGLKTAVLSNKPHAQTTAAELLYLGDTATDMKTGKSAGAFTVGALWGFRDRGELEEAHADAIIAHPLELLQYVGETKFPSPQLSPEDK